jgi:Tol biopolymer transport system component
MENVGMQCLARIFHCATLCFVASWLMATQGHGQQNDLAPFESHGDVGAPPRPGSAAFDVERQEFTIAGGGANMWDARDECHFVWKRMTGDFLIRAEVELAGDGVEPHRKLGVMVRDSLDPDSAYVDALVHGDGATAIQFRRAKGETTEQQQAPIIGADVLQLERQGGTFTMRVAPRGETFASDRTVDVALGDDVYVGLFVCSHNADVIEQGKFRNVRIVVPAADDFVPYRDYIGSNLEILDVATGRREIIHRVEDSLQAPNWTTDGAALICNANGRLHRFDLATRTPAPIDTGFATANNNDHVLSFDGKMLGISHHAADDNGRSNIYILPSTGGEPKRITQRGPSYFHGWSPDGRELVYTGDRDGKLDIYRISVDGGEEQRLTDAEGVDDGPEFTPDGKWIYFNSARTGRMQIWRMTPGGYDQQQVTDDGYNNWFPHISPDGEWIVFLSFPPEVDAGDHPFYKQVYLRLMPAGGGPAHVIAYLYGGQGTINVPSWSPDGKRLAFVSNSAGN